MKATKDFVSASVRSVARLLGGSSRDKRLGDHSRRKLRAATAPVFEALEDRRLLTVVFNPLFGTEALRNPPPYQVMNSPTVHLLLWGSGWGTGAGQANPTPVINEAKAILNSTYLSGLTGLYGSDGRVAAIDSYVDSATNPPSNFNPGALNDGHSNAQAAAEIQQVVNAGNLPSPQSDGFNDIYVIMTDPAIPANNGGYNTVGLISTPQSIFPVGVNMCTLGTDGNSINLGSVFSHEIAEKMSDPSGGDSGVRLNLPGVVPAAVGNGGDNVQIGDGEAEPANQAHYYYRIGGGASLAIVQPFYSSSFAGFIAADGNSQRFDLAPRWTLGVNNNDTFNNSYDLTVNGDQLANTNDLITVATTPSGGVSVTLNGETASFDAGRIHSVTINTGAGRDAVFVQGATVPTTINSHSLPNGPDDNVIVGSTGDVTGITAPITITNPTGHDAITISDANDPNGKVVTLGRYTSAVDGIHGTVTFGAGGPIDYVANSTGMLFVDTGTGGNVVEVHATVVPTNLTGDESPGGPIDTVQVGYNGHTEQYISQQLVLQNLGLSSIVVDDSADTNARNVTMSSLPLANGVGWGAITGLGAAEIDYCYHQTSVLTLKTGPGAGSVNVLATGTVTDLICAAPVHSFVGTSVFVGNAGSVQSIADNLTIESPTGPDTINVDDGADSTGRTVTLYTLMQGGDAFGNIANLAPGDIIYKYANTGAINVTLGIGGNTVYAYATGVPTTLIGGSVQGLHFLQVGGPDTINVGHAGSVQSIAGPLILENPASFNTVNVDDSADTTAHPVVLGTVTPAGDNAPYGSLTGLAAPIEYEYADTTALNVNLGSGANTVNVHATGDATGTPATTFSGGVAKSFHVDSGAIATLSGMTIAGGTTGGINNSGTLTVTGSSIRGNTSPYDGGGIFNTGNLTLTHSTVSGNTAANGGGIQNVFGATLAVIDSAINSNLSHGNGGGIDNQGALAISDSTITGNSAFAGAGLYNSHASVATLNNSIVWGDTGSGEIYNFALDGSAIHAQYSDIGQSGYAGVNGNINASPAFSGSTLQLLSTSPAINNGLNVLVTGGTTDLAGHPRISSGVVDMGAYEYQGALASAGLTFVQMPPAVTPVGTALTVKVDIQRNGQRTADVEAMTLTVYHANGTAFETIPLSTQPGEGTATLSLPTGTYYLRATDANNDTPVTSASFFVGTPHIAFTQPFPATVTEGQTLPPIYVALTDNDGNPINVTDPIVIAFNGGTYVPTSQSGGVATFNVPMPAARGTPYAIEADDTSYASGAVAVTSSITVNAAVHANVLTFGGVSLANPPTAGVPFAGVTVTVTQNGVPVANDQVTLSPPPGVTVSGSPATTGSNGVATFGTLTASQSGIYHLTATDSTGATTTVTFKVVAAALDSLSFATTIADKVDGVRFPTIEVDVLRPDGTIDTGDQSQVTLSLDSGNTQGALFGTLTATAINGRAYFSGPSYPAVFLTSLGSHYVLRATDADHASFTPGVSNPFAVIPGPAFRLESAAGNGTAGNAVAPFDVKVDDVSGNVDSLDNDGSQVTLTITSGPAGATLGQTFTASVVNGIATFNTVVLNKAGVYGFVTSNPNVSRTGDGSIVITAAAPSQVAFIRQPGNGAVGYTIEPPPTVAVEDAFGNVVTTDNSQVTLSIASGPSSVLDGVVTVAAQNGVATFNGVSISQIGTSYTLRATDGSLTAATSTPFNIVAPATIYVDQHATHAYNGQSWLNAFTTLQQALAVAVNGDTIDVAQGDYTLAAADPTATFQLIDGVTIQGGFAIGGGTSPNSAANPTLLDGTANHHHVVTGSGADSTAVLEGCTITGGNASGAGDANSGYGGGMIVDAGSPTIGACMFNNNTAVAGGGIFLAGSANITLTDSTLSGNSAVDGGGIEEDSTATLTLANCTLAGNSVSSGHGGAIDSQGSLQIIDSTLSANSADNGYGADIYATAGGTLDGSIVAGNIASAGTQDDLDGGPFTGSYNLIGVDNTGSFANGVNNNLVGVTPADLHLAPLADNGGPTQTMALLPGSLAIGAGSIVNGPHGNPITTDQRGVFRRANAADIGAYQSAAPLNISGQYVYLENDGSGNLDWWVGNSAFTANPLGNVNPDGTVAIASLPAAVQIGGTPGNDQLTIDFSNGNPLSSAGVSYDGGAGVNTLAIVGTPGDDTLSVGAADGSFTSTLLDSGPLPLGMANVQALQFHGGSGGNDSVNLLNGTYDLDADTPTGTPNVSVTVGAGAVANFTADQHLANLTVNGGHANIISASARTLSVGGLSITNNGLLDLGHSSLLTTTAAAVIRGYLVSAYTPNGDWSGTGLTSSIASGNPLTYTIGIADGLDPSAQDAGVMVNGQPLGPGQVLARTVLAGDANMDGTVDFFDISQVLGYQYNTGAPAGYTDGDLNFDGVVDFFDLSIVLSANYNSGAVFAPATAAQASRVAARPPTESAATSPFSVVPISGGSDVSDAPVLSSPGSVLKEAASPFA